MFFSINEGLALPCPFCGGEPLIQHSGNAYAKKRAAAIKCKSCRVKMIVGAIRNSMEWCEKTVLDQWNRRTPGDEAASRTLEGGRNAQNT